MSRLPDFFLVGAPKAGTTSLHRWLVEHPSIFMSPIREPCHFAPEAVDYTPRSRQVYEADAADLRHWLDGPLTEPRDHGLVIDWNDYLSLFRHAGSAVAVGEASGNYLQSAVAPSGIRSRIPDARIIMVLRDPIDRLFSQYASAPGAGEVRGPFGAWIDEQEKAESARTVRFGPIWTGMYASHLRRYLDVFPAEQVRVHLYEDYRDRLPPVLPADDVPEAGPYPAGFEVSSVPLARSFRMATKVMGMYSLAGCAPRGWSWPAPSAGIMRTSPVAVSRCASSRK